MYDTNAPGKRPLFRYGTVVEPTSDLGGVQGPDGEMTARERLGPGVIEKVSPEGQVRVRWMDAEFDAWMEPQDLRPLGDHAHLISIYKCDGKGNNTLMRHKIVERAGLDYNWTVELRPHRIIRTVRTDGSAWTFKTSIFGKQVNPLWTQPPEDEDAEAMAAAELAIA
ncbi:MAG: hypothetical protein ACJ78Q_05155 [Chloroflexia bacterium]